MTADNRSKTLQKDCPSEFDPLLRRLGIDRRDIWLCLDADLNLSGEYQAVWLVATHDRLAALPVGANGHLEPQHFCREQITEVRSRQGVGTGFVDVIVDGMCIQVVAYSNARSDDFHKAISKLQRWQSGEKVLLSAEDDVNLLRCSVCGMTLQFKGDVCRRCVDRGAVMGRVIKLMRPYAARAVIMLGLVLVINALIMIPPNLTKTLVDWVLAPDQAHNLQRVREIAAQKALSEYVLKEHWLLLLVGALLLTQLLRTLCQIALGRLASYVGTQLTYDMRAKVFNRLTELGVDYFDRYNVGQLMSRVAGDTEQFKGFINQLTGGLISSVVLLVAAGVSLFLLNWKLAMFTLIPAPLVVIGSVFFWKRVYPRYFRVWDANSKLHGALNNILSGIRVVMAFGQEQYEHNRFGRSCGYVRDSFRGVEYTTAVFNPTMGMIFEMGGLIVWFVGGIWVLEEHLTLGTLLAFLPLLWMFYQPLGRMTELTNWLTGFLTAAQRTFEILDTPLQIAQSDKPVSLAKARGHIEFQTVTFGYHRHEPVLKKVSFEIKPGERIGIVGKSGSGKTTIINLIGRFYDADDGRILIDGVDIRDLDKSDLRRQMGVVLQEPFLFRGTIFQNLTYGQHDADIEQVIAAAKAANCHDFIMRQPLGYDTYLGDRGAGLSGGERQRISIARALLYDPAVLILDEATSSVDTESEKLIQDALLRATVGRTTIAVAHRLSTLKNSDRIFVVDRGQIAESGHHDELLALKGIYYRLVKIQTELSTDKSIDALAIEGADTKKK